MREGAWYNTYEYTEGRYQQEDADRPTTLHTARHIRQGFFTSALLVHTYIDLDLFPKKEIR